jgi:hypothetical protein
MHFKLSWLLHILLPFESISLVLVVVVSLLHFTARSVTPSSGSLPVVATKG